MRCKDCQGTGLIASFFPIETCERCNGTGDVCDTCGGDGEIDDSLGAPAGVHTGMVACPDCVTLVNLDGNVVKRTIYEDKEVCLHATTTPGFMAGTLYCRNCPAKLIVRSNGSIEVRYE